MEGDESRPEPEGLNSESIEERLRRLEEEAQLLRDQLGAARADAEPTPEIPEPKEEQPARPATPDQVSRAEQLIRQSRLARQRGQGARADDLLREAADAAPGAAVVFEAIGDAHYEGGRMLKAKEAYGKAFKLDPKNIGVERKFGMALVASDPWSNAALLTEETAAGAKSQVLLTAMVPGLGQMVGGEVAKGLTMAAVYVGCWAWALAIPRGIQGLIEMVFGRSGPGQAQFDALVILPLGIAIVTWFIAVADSKTYAKAHSRRSVERPRPPVDMPFE